MSNKPKLLLLLFLVVVTASAAIYKWVDEKGVTQYSETPPPDQKSQKIQTPSTPSDTAERAIPAPKPLQEKSEPSGNVSPTTNVSATTGDERCLVAREELTILQQQLPVYRDAEGKLRARTKLDRYSDEREYLSDTMRKSEIERVRQEIASNCANPNDAEAQNLARKKWIKSEYCAAARAELEAIERPRAKATHQELREKRQKVESFCKE